MGPYWIIGDPKGDPEGSYSTRVDQTGYRKPHNFIRNPRGQWSTKGSTRDCKGTVRVHRGPLDGPWWTIQDLGHWGTIKDNWGAIWHVKRSFALRNFKVRKVSLSCKFLVRGAVPKTRPSLDSEAATMYKLKGRSSNMRTGQSSKIKN